MRKLIPICLLATFLLSGCTYLAFTPLKGRHQERPYVTQSNKEFEEVWDNAIEVLATGGYPIKLLDKQSGLIVCERTTLIGSFTYEDKKGEIEDPEAFIVLPRLSGGGMKYVPPKNLSGVLNILVRPLESGTRINVNLNSFQIEVGLVEEHSRESLIGMRSTGRLEDTIANLIK